MITLLPSGIDPALLMLWGGGVGSFPTDTVYGLGGSSLLVEAVERVFRLKRRSLSHPMPLLLSGKEQLEIAVAEVPYLAWRLADKFWPGALTLVLRRASRIPPIVAGGGPGVAVRVPDHPVPRSLAEGMGVPIVGTSANITGRPSPTTAAEVQEQLGDGVDFIIDGGPCPVGVESTVIDLTGVPRLLREGAIPRVDIERVLGCDLQ
ncbi:MAG: L-threonylcarbamoyladenylate synthase [Dehalococcoidia bacterium]|nr:L-threonylcarbamoyladenylate synthase [Dehalococcoidia bacterium]MDP6783173.1 L-threonylcarbamoyladenylate synthase [Dehalococcoidia bacterium]